MTVIFFLSLMYISAMSGHDSEKDLLAKKEELLDKKDELLAFMEWGDSEEDAQQQLKIDAIDQQLYAIDQLLIPPQDRSSLPRGTESRSPAVTGSRRSHAPDRKVAAVKTRPIVDTPVFPRKFLDKGIRDVVVVVCHGGCSAFDAPPPIEKRFKTKFDTVFTSELGLLTYVGDSSYQLCRDLFEAPFPDQGYKLVSRLGTIMREHAGGLGIKQNALNFKQMNDKVTDMNIFTAGEYPASSGGTIDDGIFCFSDEFFAPNTDEEVKERDIAPNLFRRVNIAPTQTTTGRFVTSFPSYSVYGRHKLGVKLSDLLKTGGALEEYGFNPELTTVIIVSCRVIPWVHMDDHRAIQSPSTSASVAAASLLQPSHYPRPLPFPSASVPRGHHHAEHTDDPRLHRMDESSEGEEEVQPSWSETGGRTKSKRQSKRKSKRQSKRQSKRKSKRKSKRRV